MWPRNMDTTQLTNITSKDNTFGFEGMFNFYISSFLVCSTKLMIQVVSLSQHEKHNMYPLCFVLELIREVILGNFLFFFL